jgi:uncharacterized protein (TIGR02996 family)
MEQEALLAVIRANPDDRTARLVYADWLDESGESVLAEYARVECELMMQEPGSSAWEDALQRLCDICKSANRNFGGWEYAADLTRLKDKIDRLRKLDVRMEVYGARWGDSGHKYQLSPPLHEADLFEFELRHGLTLPAEYRGYLLQVGNGRVGPYSGLNPLNLAKDYAAFRKTFVITPGLAREIVAAAIRAFATDNWENIPQPTENGRDCGYIHLAGESEGGTQNVLVISGSLRGQMWGYGTHWAPYQMSYRVGSQTLSFIAWYEHWLDKWLAPGAIEEWVGRLRR